MFRLKKNITDIFKYFLNVEKYKSDSKKVIVTKNGPYLVTGNVPLGTEIAVAGEENQHEFWKKGKEFSLQETYALCRCGRSKNKPYCDATHIKAKFSDGDPSIKIIKKKD